MKKLWINRRGRSAWSHNSITQIIVSIYYRAHDMFSRIFQLRNLRIVSPIFLSWKRTNLLLVKKHIFFSVLSIWENKNNSILLPKLFWPIARKNVLVIEKIFWNLRLKAENLQIFWVEHAGGRKLFYFYSPLIQPLFTWWKWNMDDIFGLKFHLP